MKKILTLRFLLKGESDNMKRSNKYVSADTLNALTIAQNNVDKFLKGYLHAKKESDRQYYLALYHNAYRDFELLIKKANKEFFKNLDKG